MVPLAIRVEMFADLGDIREYSHSHLLLQLSTRCFRLKVLYYRIFKRETIRMAMDSSFRIRRHNALRILCLLLQGTIKDDESDLEENSNELLKDLLHLRPDCDRCWEPDLLHHSERAACVYNEVGSPCQNPRDWSISVLSHPKLLCHGHYPTNQGLLSFGPLCSRVHRDGALDNMHLDLDRSSRCWQRQSIVMDLPGRNAFH